MNDSLTEGERESIRGAPKGTMFLLLIFMVLFAAGWLGMYFLMFLKHGPVS